MAFWVFERVFSVDTDRSVYLFSIQTIRCTILVQKQRRTVDLQVRVPSVQKPMQRPCGASLSPFLPLRPLLE